jgi:hypothetical protein
MLLLDMTIAGGGFLLYELGRVATRDGQTEAFRNTGHVMALQRALHLPDETAVQRFVLNHDTLLRMTNRTYSFMFLSTVIGFLVWLYLNNLPVYRRVRNALGLATMVSLGIFALFPMAPPRLVPASNLIDSHARVGAHHGFVNQFAAMPSLHIGWLSLVGWGMWISLRRVRGLMLGIAPASLMMLSVVATGNHFWLDGMVGASLCLGALVVTRPYGFAVEGWATLPPVRVPRRLTVTAMIEQRERVRNALVLLCGLLLFTVVGRIMDPVFTRYWGYLAGQVVLLAAAVIVIECHCRRGPLLSAWTYGIISIAMTVDVLGTAGHLYDRFTFYDKIVHFMGTAAVTAVAHDIFMYHRWGSRWARTYALGMIAMTIGIVVGVVWEVYEAFGDVVFATARSGGVTDTTYDILFDSIGAITATLILSWNWAESASGDTFVPRPDASDS